MQLAQRLDRISEPQTIKMAKLSRELKAQGMDVIDLSLGEPDFRTPAHICAAAEKAIEAGYTKYTPVAGIPELRNAVCTKLKNDNQLEYTPDQIVVSTGAKQSLANAILALIDPGEEAIIPTPYWVTYGAQVSFAEGVPVYVPCGIENDYKISPEQLEAAITDKTRLFIFSSPCNPTGSVYTREELQALVSVFEKHPHIYIISDEIYEYINYTGKHESIAQFDTIKDRVVLVNGFSKGYAMTGWRLGYIAARKEIAAACEKIQSQFTSGTNSIAQRAAVAALLEDNTPSMDMVKAFRERKDYVIRSLAKIPGIRINNPSGAFYAFPDISAFLGKKDGEDVMNTSEDIAMFLLHKGLVTVVDGAAFGSPNNIRISFATSMDNLIEAIKRIEYALGLLQ
ncbi:pyridoxal phosphate-dependent aminotransferase [Rurimicrobium arvi]|uniref:Aminotransferase n=2 Tax=Rurimicrobium arvi TaxID=2049916 RepID=A0ABP8MY50_9BACT